MSLKNLQKYILSGNLRKKTSFCPQNLPFLWAYFAGFIVSTFVVTTVFYKRMQA